MFTPNDQMRLARAYVPFQIFSKRLDPMEGLLKGTIFPELYFPYRGHKR
ncbi:MAG: spore coat associated protein CotJA [Firmicutes bacterium]|nr:spore coat associated protein CotJA [Bacillota bacterium]